MKMFKIQVLIFLIIFVRNSSGVIDALYETGKRVQNFYSVLNQSNLASISNAKTVRELFGDGYQANQNITNNMYEIHVELNAIEASISPRISSTLLEILKSNAMIVKYTDEMEIFIKSINDDYQKFHLIMIANEYITHGLFDDSASVFLNIESKIRKIRQIMTDGQLLLDSENLVTAIARHIVIQREALCGNIQPITEIFVQLFEIVIIAEIKTSLMLSLVNKQRFTENQEWKTANDFAMTQFWRYFESYVTTLRENLGKTEGLYVRPCDPDREVWILDGNTYELNVAEAAIFQYDSTKCDLNPCEDMWQQKRSQCDARFFDERSGCASELDQCKEMYDMKACVLKNGPQKFQYVNSTILGLLGSNSECPKDDGYIIQNKDSKYRTCACDCNGNHNKISAVLMKSRVNSNEVITGLRFINTNNILYIQPRVGTLEANGYIQQKTHRWLTIPKNCKAFHILNMGIEKIIFFLDDLRLPAGFALTGVQVTKVKRGLLEGFTIGILGVPFNYRSGKLDHSRAIDVAMSANDAGISVVLQPINPFETNLHYTPTRGNRMYVELKRSFSKNDFGQSTLPFFDAVPVSTDPPSALSGMGIFHKGVEGYAGFISLRAYGVGYTGYFENFTSAHTIESKIQLFI